MAGREGSRIPEAVVLKAREAGDAVFDSLSAPKATSPLNARWLSEAQPDDLNSGLKRLCALYESWIEADAARILALDPSLQPAAQSHMQTCREALARLTGGVELLARDPMSRQAFQMANRAM